MRKHGIESIHQESHNEKSKKSPDNHHIEWNPLQEKLTGQLSTQELAELRKLRLVRKALKELKKKGKDADIPICPNCKSARLIRLTSFHDLGYIGSFQPAYYCIECGWYGRNLTLMSNRDMEDAVLKDLQENFDQLMEEDRPF